MDMNLIRSAARQAAVLLLAGALLAFSWPTGPGLVATALLMLAASGLLIWGSSAVSGAVPVTGQGPSPATAVSAATTFGLVPGVGTEASYARADHTHGTPQAPVLAGDASGPAAGNRVSGLQGVPVSSAPPAAGQALVFDGGAWAPRNLL
jgi:hypothetical protein